MRSGRTERRCERTNPFRLHRSQSICAEYRVNPSLLARSKLKTFSLFFSRTELARALVSTVREEIGPVSAFKKFLVVERLPKTRSGKIARNTLAALVNGKPFRVPSTIEDSSVYEELRTELTDAGYEDLGQIQSN